MENWAAGAADDFEASLVVARLDLLAQHPNLPGAHIVECLRQLVSSDRVSVKMRCSAVSSIGRILCGQMPLDAVAAARAALEEIAHDSKDESVKDAARRELAR